MKDLVGGGLKNETRAEITDFSQDLSVSIQIVHRARADFDELKHPQVRRLECRAVHTYDRAESLLRTVHVCVCVQFFEIVGQVDAAAFAKQLDAERDGARVRSPFLHEIGLLLAFGSTLGFAEII
jgi:hypothetical protein